MLDPVLTEVIYRQFKAIVEEMAVVTLRTGYTVFVKETGDFGACLVSPQGEVFAAPTGTALNFMVGLPAKHAIEACAPYAEGDVCITNDHESTRGLATHLPDIWTWRPVFIDGELLAFAFNFINATDIGGLVPGSLSPASTDIHQEGLRIPPSKLFRGGELNNELLGLILANSRVPNDNWGDIKAQVSSLTTAQDRLTECVGRYGLDVVRRGIDAVLDQAEQHARALIETLPDGTWSFSDYVEADHVGLHPIRIKLTMEVAGDQLTLDFTGSDHQVQAAFNLPSWSQDGHYMICIPLLNYVRAVDATAPYNSGLLRSVSVHAPQGSVLNPEGDAAVGVRSGTMVRDCIMGCLAQALPDVFPAADAGIMSIVVLSTIDPHDGHRSVTVAQPLVGGSGARPDKDGVDGSSFVGGWLRNVPCEVLETESPVLVERYGYAPDTGGAGRYRGGVGLQFRMRMLGPETAISARGFDRCLFRPWGLAGGRPGARSRIVLNPDTPNAEDVGKITALNLEVGDVIEFHTAGGGGFGPPNERDRAGIDADLHRGVVTAEADDAWGDGDAGSWIDFGPERAEHEQSWTDEARTRLVQVLGGYPWRLRPWLRRRIVAQVDISGRPASAWTVDDLGVLATTALQRLRLATPEPTPDTRVERRTP